MAMAQLFKESTRGPWLKLAVGLFLLGSTANFGLTYYLSTHRPHAIEAGEGRVRAMRHRGSVVYVTIGEDRLLDFLEIAPMVFLICAGLLHARDLMPKSRDVPMGSG
jgi:hypothetical protein